MQHSSQQYLTFNWHIDAALVSITNDFTSLRTSLKIYGHDVGKLTIDASFGIENDEYIQSVYVYPYYVLPGGSSKPEGHYLHCATVGMAKLIMPCAKVLIAKLLTGK